MRGRWIKPEFWSSRTLAKVSRDARLLFVGLWTYVDDEGRAPADLTLIRAAIFPLDRDVTDVEISRWMRELAERRLIVTYRARPRAERRGNATELVQVRAWSEHQSVSHAKESLYPAPPTRKRRSGASPERRRSSSVSSSSKSQRREVVAESGGAPENPNGSGAYDPDAIGPAAYDVPIPGLDEHGLEPTPEPEPSSEPRPSPADWRTRPNPWDVGEGKTVADVLEEGSS